MELTDITVTSIPLVFTVFSEKGRHEEIVERETYGLSFCLSGQITYMHNGKKFVSDKGNAVILPQGQSYSIYGDKTGQFYVIDFTCAEKLCDTILLFPLDNPDECIRDFNTLYNLHLFDGNRAKIMSLFYNIIHNVYSNKTINILLAPAMTYIKDNYSDSSLNNEILAKQCKISEVYFRKQFIKQYKISPKQFVLNLRISKAKLLLSEGANKISNIAEMCGFSSVYHFSREFKIKEGITPSEYRKQYRIYKI